MLQRLFLLLAGLSLVACEDDTKSGMQTTDLGNRYTYVNANDDGQLANPGDYIYFQAQLKNEADSTIYDTRDGGGETPVIQALSDTIINENTGPVEDIVRKLRVGERAVIRTNISEYPPQAKPPGMQDDTVLLYDVEVTEIIAQEEYSARQETLRAEQEAKATEIRGREEEVLSFTQQVYDDYQAGELDDQLQSTDNGVRYIIHEEGTGPEAEPGSNVVVQYVGRLSENGEIFDQSFERGMGIPFPLGAGRVIPGWDEGIGALQQGDRATLIIPSELGYGAQGTPNGSIPPNSELMFYVELEEVQ
ncbi:MAG: FKBP-type peptidyl-prolyl cis-trans isomerase [Lewinella sp.]